MKGVLSRALIV